MALIGDASGTHDGLGIRRAVSFSVFRAVHLGPKGRLAFAERRVRDSYRVAARLRYRRPHNGHSSGGPT